MEHVHLSKAPVAEAIIDIGAKLPSDVTVAQLKALHAQVAETYPTPKERRRWEHRMMLVSAQQAAPGQVSSEQDVDGHMFASRDGRQVVQFRIDGFTLNRLSPYGDWESLVAEAKRLWAIYVSAVKPAVIVRLAVRYLNVMMLPAPANYSEYLTMPPVVPAGYPTNLRRYLHQVSVSDPQTKIVAEVAQGMLDVATPAAFLDIDVSKDITAPTETVNVWELLSQLRVVKNNIFFGSITPKMVELYK